MKIENVKNLLFTYFLFFPRIYKLITRCYGLTKGFDAKKFVTDFYTKMQRASAKDTLRFRGDNFEEIDR